MRPAIWGEVPFEILVWVYCVSAHKQFEIPKFA